MMPSEFVDGLPAKVSQTNCGGGAPQASSLPCSSLSPQHMRAGANVTAQASKKEITHRAEDESQLERSRMAKKATIGTHLTELQEEDPRKVFIARRICGMGFRSQELLAKHYSQFDKVVRVLVPHSKVKPATTSGAHRVRPGSLGFVVMNSVESVQRILALGREQVVCSCRVHVEPFEQSVHKKRALSVEETSSTGGSPDIGSSGSCTNGSNSKGGTDRASSGSCTNGSNSKGSYSNGSGSNGSDNSTGSDKGSGSGGSPEDTKTEEALAGEGSTDSQIGESSDAGSGADGVPPPAALQEPEA